MADENAVYAKCAWRLIPFMMLLYVVSYVDRVNVSFAALTLNKDLGFSPSVFGFGAGIFFLGYALCQVPCNAILERAGARRVVFCIMAVWGLLSASTAFVRDETSFYTLRFFLGVAESGFFPGMVFYLTLWFPKAHRARFTAIFVCGIPLASIIGGPLSTVILGMDGVAGLHGWQWLFLIEGLPAFLLAFAVLKLLPDGPGSAPWLSSDEKKIIASHVAPQGAAAQRDLLSGLRDPRVLALGLVGFSNGAALYGTQLWLPQMIKAMGYSNLAVGFVVALPYLAAMAAMIVWGRSSDRRGERIWHIAIPCLVAVTGFLGASVAHSNLLMLVSLTIAIVGVLAYFGPFFSLPSSFLSGPAAAGGIALINSFANFGGFLGPTVIGVIKEQTGSYAVAMVALGAGLTASAVIVLMLGRAMTARQVQIA
jgi:ACS family tartrate transporter-like MFS transporter